jgi:serine/threonine-protein phosphatase 2A regulatory subunit B''
MCIRFFELDADKDSKISREDLLRYGEHALSEAIVDRYSNIHPPAPFRITIIDYT